jgi:hypothetical protein
MAVLLNYRLWDTSTGHSYNGVVRVGDVTDNGSNNPNTTSIVTKWIKDISIEFIDKHEIIITWEVPKDQKFVSLCFEPPITKTNIHENLSIPKYELNRGTWIITSHDIIIKKLRSSGALLG